MIAAHRAVVRGPHVPSLGPSRVRKHASDTWTSIPRLVIRYESLAFGLAQLAR